MFQWTPSLGAFHSMLSFVFFTRCFDSTPPFDVFPGMLHLNVYLDVSLGASLNAFTPCFHSTPSFDVSLEYFTWGVSLDAFTWCFHSMLSLGASTRCFHSVLEFDAFIRCVPSNISLDVCSRCFHSILSLDTFTRLSSCFPTRRPHSCLISDPGRPRLSRSRMLAGAPCRRRGARGVRVR